MFKNSLGNDWEIKLKLQRQNPWKVVENSHILSPSLPLLTRNTTKSKLLHLV